MRLGRNKYAKVQNAQQLPVEMFEAYSMLYNKETGFDMIYQENKVHNLKVAAAPIDGLLIRPGETFSFYQAIRHADRHTPYKDGLTVVDGRLLTERGGGLCQLSNLLFWLFLHGPLTIVERHGHAKKEFPDPEGDALLGVDATIAEGWKDLKVKNETEATFQISIRFDEERMLGWLRCDRHLDIRYSVANGEVSYVRRKGRLYQEVDVSQERILRETEQKVAAKKLYRNSCEITYPLPESTVVIQEG